MPPSRRRPLHAIMRFVASVLIVSGSLLVLDALTTLLWQEPISWALGSGSQARLKRQLSEATPYCSGRDLAAAARVCNARTRPGEPLGRILLPKPDRSYVIVQGIGFADLRKGPGHYRDTPLPGEPGTVAVAGHRTTYLAPFRTIDKLRRGDRIALEMPYGHFAYAVEKTRVVPPTASEVKKPVGHDQLVLTACHPLYSAAHRIVVFARLVQAEPR